MTDAAHATPIKDAFFEPVIELLRETFEGGLPGQGTQYLDHSGGLLTTLHGLTAEQASRSLDGHPSIASHARHMAFHLSVVGAWILGDHSKRDWKGSFLPGTVSEAEWIQIQADLESARAELVRVLGSLSDAQFVEEGGGIGAIAHLAYHLGAIRQLMHRV
jgi:hypothetical protein